MLLNNFDTLIEKSIKIVLKIYLQDRNQYTKLAFDGSSIFGIKI